MDAVVRITRDGERATAVEEQLALTIESALMSATSTIGQCIGGAIRQNDISACY